MADRRTEIDAWFAEQDEPQQTNSPLDTFSETRSPDEVANERAIADEVGQPPQAVRAHPELFSRSAEASRTRRATEGSPRLQTWLDDPNNYAVARDDVENLSVFERLAVAVGREAGRRREGPEQQALDFATINPLTAPFALPLNLPRLMQGAGRQNLYRQGELDVEAGRLQARRMQREHEGLELEAEDAARLAELRARPDQEDWGPLFVGPTLRLLPQMVEGVTRAAREGGEGYDETVQFMLGDERAQRATARRILNGEANAAEVLITGASPVVGALGAFGGGARGYLGSVYDAEAGNLYDSLREQGIEADIAYDAASQYGAWSTGLEFALDATGLRAMGVTRLAARTFLREGAARAVLESPALRAATALGGGAASQGAEESLQRLSEIIHEDLAQQEGEGAARDVGAAWRAALTPEAIQSILVAGSIGAQGGFGMASIPAGTNLALDLRAAQRAEAHAAANEQRILAAQNSRVRERGLTSTLESAIGAMDESQTFIDADKFVEHFQGAGANAYAVADELGVGADGLAQALASHGQVAISTARLHARVLSNPSHVALAEHTRAAPDADTPAEAKLAGERLQADIQRLVEETQALQADSEIGQAVEARVRDLFSRAAQEGGPRSEVSARYAKLVAALPRAMMARARASGDAAYAERLDGQLRKLFGENLDIAGPGRDLSAQGAELRQGDDDGQNGNNLVEEDDGQSSYQARLEAVRSRFGGQEAPARSGQESEGAGGVREDAGAGRAADARGSDSASRSGQGQVRGELGTVSDALSVSGLRIVSKSKKAGTWGAYRASIDTPISFGDLDAGLTAGQGVKGGPTYIDFDIVGDGDPRESGVYIRFTSVNKTVKGQGAGLWLYRQLIDWAHRQELPVFSDHTVSAEAQRVYNALAARGYNVRTVNPYGTDPDDKSYFNMQFDPVFQIDPTGMEAAYDAATLPEGDYQIDGPPLREYFQELKQGDDTLGQAQDEGYEGSDTGEAVEWLRAVAKGLPMDEASRMARAREMGFDVDTPLYHSTLTDLQAFEPHGKFYGNSGLSGIHLTDNAEMASRYLERYGDLDYKSRPFSKNVVPVLIRPGNVRRIKGKIYDGPQATQGFPIQGTYKWPTAFDGIDTVIRPDVITSRGDVGHRSPGDEELLGELTGDAGISGNEYILRDPSRVRSRFAAFDPDVKDSPNLLAQGEQGAIRFDPEKWRPGEFDAALIRLTDSYDLSTFVHEFGHLGHLILESIATDAAAPAEFKAMWDSTLSWWGLSQEQWSALTPEQRAPYFEQWARSFEAYLLEGKAPALSLREVFATFKQWLTQIYRTVLRLNDLGARLSPEIRDVFDRLLASDEEIAEARAAMGSDFALAREAFKTEEEFAQYQQAIAEAREAQEAELRARAMDAYARKSKRWWRGERERVRDAASRYVDSDPARRAEQWLAFEEWRALAPTEMSDEGEIGYVPPANAIEEIPEGLLVMRLAPDALQRDWPDAQLPTALRLRTDPEAVLAEAMSLKAQDKGRGAFRAPRLRKFIKDNGGIQDPDGRIRAAIGGGRRAPGVINQNGKTPEEMMRLATEAGYFGDGAARELRQGPDAGGVGAGNVGSGGRQPRRVVDIVTPRGETHETIVNPSEADILRLTKPVRAARGSAVERGVPLSSSRGVRYIRDLEGNIYVGNSYDVTHHDLVTRHGLPNRGLLDGGEIVRREDGTLELQNNDGARPLPRDWLNGRTPNAPDGGSGGAGWTPERVTALRSEGFDTETKLYHGSPDAMRVARDGFRTIRQRTGRADDPRWTMFFATDERAAATYASPAAVKRAQDYAGPLELAPDSQPGVLEAVARGRFKDVDMAEAGDAGGVNRMSEVNRARAEGFDGVRLHNVRDDFSMSGKPTTVVAVFNPDNIRFRDNPATDAPNGGASHPGFELFQGDTAPIFVSQVERVVEQSKTARAPAAQWLATIKKAPGVKREEIEWIGLEDWLNAQQGAVSREDVLAFVRANGVRVEETVLGGESAGADPELQARLLPLIEARERLERSLDQYVGRPGVEAPGTPTRAKIDATRTQIRELSDQINPLQQQIADASRANSTKWSQYTLPGGENYRELLLRLPHEGPGYVMLPTGGSRPTGFRSSHWDEPNILAHVRFNERTDSQGRRTLFIEEVQSDWHQAGRERGYAPADREAAARAALEEAGLVATHNGTNWVVTDKNGDATPNRLIGETQVRGPLNGSRPFPLFAADISQVAAMATGRGELMPGRSVPDAPFKNNAWASLAMKRMIRWASENGFEQIAWTRGQHQVERFSLAHHIETLRYAPETQELQAVSKDSRIVFQRRIPRSALAETVGKEASERLLNTPVRDGLQEISGLEIESGGEGMRAFYDKILPNIANDLGKKFGARVGEATIEVGAIEARNGWETAGGAVRDAKPAGAESVHALPITPEMRGTVSTRGFELFSDKQPDLEEFMSTLIADLRGERAVYSAKDKTATAQQQELEDARAWFEAHEIDLSADKEAIRAQIVAALEKDWADPNAVHPDDAAAFFNFSSGDELIQALSALKPRAQAIEDRIDQMLEEEHGDAGSRDRIQEEARLAAHAEAQARRIEIEFLAVQQATGGRKRPVSNMARAAAARAVERMSIRELRGHDKFLAGERRAARNALEAMSKGKRDQAAEWKIRQLNSFWLYRLARDAAEEMDKFQNYARKYDREGFRSGFLPDGARHLEQIDQILETIDLRKNPYPSRRARASFAEYIQSLQDEGIDTDDIVELDPAFLEAIRRKPFENLTLEEARGVRDVIQNFETLGKRWNQVLTDRKHRKLNEVIDELQGAAAAEYPKRARVVPSIASRSKFEQAADLVMDLHGSMVKAEQLFRVMDGLKANGPWFSVFIPAAQRAENVKTDRLIRETERFQQIMSVYSKKEMGRMLLKREYIPQIGDNLTKLQQIGVLLYSGTEYRRNGLMKGFGWNEQQLQAVIDRLDERDVRFAQAIWDFLESFQAESFDLDYRVRGVRPQADPGITVQTSIGPVQGKYFPIKYDPDHPNNTRAAKAQAKEAVEQLSGGSYRQVGTKRGRLKQLVGTAGMAFRTDPISIIAEHVEETVHDLSHREFVIDARRLIASRRVRDSVRAVVGRFGVKVLDNWIAKVEQPQPRVASPWERLAGQAKNNATIVNMGLKVTTALIQELGTLGAVPRAGILPLLKQKGITIARDYPMFLARQTARLFGAPETLPARVQFVFDRSEFMKRRMGSFDRDVKDALATKLDARPGILPTVPKGVQDKMMILSQLMDMAVSVPAWLAGYESALAGKVNGIEQGDEQAAIEHGDSIVRTTQSGGAPKDLSAILASDNQFWRLATMFFSWSNTFYNQMFVEQIPGVLSGKINPSRFAANMMFIWFAPALITMWFYGRMEPQEGEDDEDFVKRAALEATLYPLQTIPILRDSINAYITGYDYQFSPAQAAFEAPVKILQAADRGNGEQVVKQSLLGAGYLFGLPSRQMWITGEGLADIATGEEDVTEEPIDSARELLIRDTR